MKLKNVFQNMNDRYRVYNGLPTVLICSYFLTSHSDDTMPRHLMDDQDDISVSGHSIGIVENPLFGGDNDEFGSSTPSFAALSAKEKEAEVRSISDLYVPIMTTSFYTGCS